MPRIGFKPLQTLGYIKVFLCYGKDEKMVFTLPGNGLADNVRIKSVLEHGALHCRVQLAPAEVSF